MAARAAVHAAARAWRPLTRSDAVRSVVRRGKRFGLVVLDRPGLSPLSPASRAWAEVEWARLGQRHEAAPGEPRSATLLQLLRQADHDTTLVPLFDPGPETSGLAVCCSAFTSYGQRVRDHPAVAADVRWDASRGCAVVDPGGAWEAVDLPRVEAWFLLLTRGSLGADALPRVVLPDGTVVPATGGPGCNDDGSEGSAREHGAAAAAAMREAGAAVLAGASPRAGVFLPPVALWELARHAPGQGGDPWSVVLASASLPVAAQPPAAFPDAGSVHSLPSSAPATGGTEEGMAACEVGALSQWHAVAVHAVPAAGLRIVGAAPPPRLGGPPARPPSARSRERVPRTAAHCLRVRALTTAEPAPSSSPLLWDGISPVPSDWALLAAMRLGAHGVQAVEDWARRAHAFADGWAEVGGK